MKYRLKKRSSIRERGLYDLEEIMGDSDGHGAGFGGEDIAWYVNYRKDAKSYKRLEINMRTEAEIHVTYTRIYDDFDRDEDVLDLKDLPERWSKRLQNSIAKHCCKS